MTNVERQMEDVLGVWSEDPRSVEGVLALSTLQKPSVDVKPTWAASDLLVDSDDPRVVSTMAAIRDARKPDRLFMPGGQMALRMKAGVDYPVV